MLLSERIASCTDGAVHGKRIELHCRKGAREMIHDGTKIEAHVKRVADEAIDFDA